jgi:TPP-dependent indolepyruvate ferredoxin oxidoreductase alpha subunit
LLTGNEALARALSSARVRAAWSFPGSPLTRVEVLLEKKLVPVPHRFAVNEHVAVSMALGGALLDQNNTCALVKHVGMNVALDALATFGLVNELRSAALIVEGVDAAPATSQNAQDNRAAMSSVARLPQLEAGSADEVYHLTRLAAQASLKLGMPLGLRVGARSLDDKANVQEAPPGLPAGKPTYARATGPFVCTAGTYRYHMEKRQRRLGQLQPLMDLLTVRTGDEGAKAVILAGHLGPRAHARSWARRLPTLRLPGSWPLPKDSVTKFLLARDEVLVLEEGEPFLEREIQALVHREGLACKVRGAGGARPLAIDDDRLDVLLGRFGGRVRADIDPVVREPAVWKAAAELIAGFADDDGEPWPLFLARAKKQMKTFAPSDPRLTLLRSLRQLARPTLIVGDPGTTGVLGIPERLVDVKMHMGSAAPVAGALSAAQEVEERAGTPLAVALIGDTNHYHSELNGLIDNAIARREVLHVLVVNRCSEMTAGVKTPYLADDALEAQLRSAGLHVATAHLDDPGLGAAVAYAASRPGPRALVCYGTTPTTPAESDG